MLRPMLATLTILCFLSPLALAQNPPEPVRWSFKATEDGDVYASGRAITTTWSQTREGGYLLDSLSVGGHELIDGLLLPSAIGPPDARGSTLAFRGIEDPNIRLVLHDNPSAVTDIRCTNPPEPVTPELPPNPCVLAFPAGHEILAVQSDDGHQVLEVVMRGSDGEIIPCVRVVIDGVSAIDGRTVAFAGDLHLNAIGVEDPNI